MDIWRGANGIIAEQQSAQCCGQSQDKRPPQTTLILLFYKMEQTDRFLPVF